MFRILRIIHFWFFFCCAVFLIGFGIIGGILTKDVPPALIFVILGSLCAAFSYLLRKKKTSEQSTNLKKSDSFNKKQLNSAGLTAFKLLAKGILEDNSVSYDEAVALQSFLAGCSQNDTKIRHLKVVVDNVLHDDILDKDEAEELRVLLSEFLDSQKPIKSQKKTKKAIRLKQKKYKKSVIENAVTTYAELEAGLEYFINYIDSVGNISEREIFVHSIKKNKAGNDIVYARCKAANANRSFRLDRITMAIDLETGEVII